MWPQTWHQIKAQFFRTDWQTLLPTIFIQLITWSYPPFAYLVGLAGTRFTSHFGALFLYELCIGMALTLILTNHFQAPLTLIPLAGGLGLALIGFSQTPLLLGLLLLLPLFLLVLQVPQCDLQNGLGLTTLGALLTLTIPVACAFNASHYLSWAILGYFFPLAATIWFLLAAASPATGQQHDLILTGTALVLLLAILIRPLSGETILAIMLTMAAWFYLLRFPHHQPQFIYLNLVQLVLIVLIYWT